MYGSHNISYDPNYISALTLKRQRQRQRHRKYRRRHLKRLELANSKKLNLAPSVRGDGGRIKPNNILTNARMRNRRNSSSIINNLRHNNNNNNNNYSHGGTLDTNDNTTIKNLSPLPKNLLHRMAKVLAACEAKYNRNNDGVSVQQLSENAKNLNGDDNSTIPNNDNDTICQQKQQQQQLHNPHTQTAANSNDEIVMNKTINSNNNNNNNNNNNINDSNNSINNKNNVSSISDKGNVINNAIGATQTSAATTTTTTSTSASTLSSVVKLENSATALASATTTTTSGGDGGVITSPDDSNEPLSKIRKLTDTEETVDDEDNVNLAQLSNLIRHKVRKEELPSSRTTTTNTLRHNEAAGTRIYRTRNSQNEIDARLKRSLTLYADLSDSVEDDEIPILNQMADVTRLSRHQRRRQRHHHHHNQLHRKPANITTADMPLSILDNNQEKEIEKEPQQQGLKHDHEQVMDDAECDFIGSLSPSSSQRLDVCNELLLEIRRDWLHFRPQTPLSDTSSENSLEDWKYTTGTGTETETAMSERPIVNWSENTPITVEMMRIDSASDLGVQMVPPPLDDIAIPSFGRRSLSSDNDDNRYFICNPFKYADLEPDAQLLQTVYNAQDNAKDDEEDDSKGAEFQATTPPAVTAAVGDNASGESANEGNMLEECDETEEKMLDNILQECQIDDIKTLNQATTFWNGLLDGETPEEVAGDVETAAKLLESCASDDKKNKDVKEKRQSAKCRVDKTRQTPVALGSSVFGVTTTSQNENFFSKQEDMKVDNEPQVAITLKEESMEQHPTINVKDGSSNIVEEVAAAATPLQTILQQKLNAASANAILPKVTTVPAQLIQTVGNFPQYVSVMQQQPQIAGASRDHQTQAQMTNVGTLMTIPNAANGQQSHQILQIPPQLRAVALQQVHPGQQKQRQQQLVLQMQRDLSGGTTGQVITQLIPSSVASSVAGNASNLRTPTLTPIGSSATSGSHMIYTTTSADGTGPPKIFIQKATPVSVATSVAGQVTSSGLTTNALFTLSNIKVDSDGNQIATVVGQPGGSNLLTLDGGSNTVPVSGTSTPLNIISTASGQQVAVHNIGNMPSVGQVVSASALQQQSPVIVTTTARNHQQLTQPQIIHAQPGQQFVWRQIATTTNAGVNSDATGVITTGNNADGTPTTGATMAVGSKFVLTSRPGHKRHLNGPEGTDINKLLLNRKLSQQRKIISQQPQHQIQLTKQQMQALQAQQQQQQQQQQKQLEDDANSNSTTTTTSTPQLAQLSSTQQQQQQAFQKVQMQGGKVIKMSSSPYPLIVSDLNMQQHQQQQTATQQQLKQNATIAGNHNYSLQPATTIITSQSSQPLQVSGNKILLTTSNNNATTGIGNDSNVGGSGTNFTITNVSDLTTAQGQNQNQNQGQLQQGQQTLITGNAAGQKLPYKELQNSQNVKLMNLISSLSAGNATGITVQQGQPHQQKLKRERFLNVIGTATTVDGSATTTAAATTTPEQNKRIQHVYNLLNVKQLQRNNIGVGGGAGGAVQMQIGPGGATHTMLRGRVAAGNNQTILTTNMRTVPITATLSNNTSNSNNSNNSNNNSNNSNNNNNNNNNNNGQQLQINAAALSQAIATTQSSSSSSSSSSVANAVVVSTTTPTAGTTTTAMSTSMDIDGGGGGGGVGESVANNQLGKNEIGNIESLTNNKAGGLATTSQNSCGNSNIGNNNSNSTTTTTLNANNNNNNNSNNNIAAVSTTTTINR